uniref:dCMP deaminase n=1 Tax=Amphimedon queenslandica TaxID=400682 RepID=A0A1X7UP02_AMPQE
MYTRKPDRKSESDMKRSENFFIANKIEIRELKTSNETEPEKKIKERIEQAKMLHEGPAEKLPNEAYTKAITWEEFFMGIAILSTKKPGQYDRKAELAVGACIVSPCKQVMAVGYSGYPEDMELGEIEQKDHKEYLNHAEYKAIIGGPLVRGCTLYVTSYPCDTCARLIVQSGITEVVYDKDKGYPNSKEILRQCLEVKSNIRKCNPENFTDSLYK